MRVLCLIAIVLVITATLLVPAVAQVSVTTSRNDNARTGQNTGETILKPSNVNVNQFGKLFSQAVDGYVYAQPLYSANVSIPGKGTHNVVYVATEHNTVYAFDADSNTGTNAAPLWKVSFTKTQITPPTSDDVGCGDLVPEIGITSTPVIDPSTGTLYVVVKTKNSLGKFFHKLHALNVATGAEKFSGPRVIAASVRGAGDGSVNGVVKFDPFRQHQRVGLLLQNGNVYVSSASHCDIGPYHGWVISYNAATLKKNGTWNSTPNGGLGGVWQGGPGVAADTNSNVYLATGNGTFDVDQSGQDYGDSIVKLGPPAANHIKPLDFFTPFNQNDLNSADADLGSGGLVLLPNQNGPHAHLLVQAGKEGTIYLVDRDNMGHFNPDNNNQIVQSLPNAVGGIWGAPAWWNNNLYFGGIFDNLTQFTFNPASGLLSTGPTTHSATFYGYPGPTPSVSANGTANGIVWAIQTDTSSAILHAYDATNLSRELYNSTQKATDDAGGPVKFSVPTIANGKVYVPAVQQISVYGLR
jgi:hypothetical protein